MNKCNDKQKKIDSEKISNDIAKNIGRKLEQLELHIIDLLYAGWACDLRKRFIIDDENQLLVAETGNRAGVVELTDDCVCVFKAESVIAPSGRAAGGEFSSVSRKMCAEVFLSGAQPVASLLSLSANISPDGLPRTDFREVVKAAGTFGNTFGLPVVGGDIRCNDSEQQNITAGLLTVGLSDKNFVLSSGCFGEGNLLYLIGGGAAPDSGNQPQSDAFAARTDYELICDLHEAGAIVACSGIGHGGVLRACADMAVNGRNGIELCVDTLIDKPDNFCPLSEIVPDKILVIVEKKHVKTLENTCRKWKKQFEQAGVVVRNRKLSVSYRGKTLADLPVDVLTSFFEPAQDAEISLPHMKKPQPTTSDMPFREELGDVIDLMLTRPNLLSQHHVFDCFDSTIGVNNMATNFISDAPVIQIKNTSHAIAVSFCRSTADVAQYPEAVNLTVAEAVRKVICSGGVPRVLTGCLNYGGEQNADTENALQNINGYISLACKKFGLASSGISVNRTEAGGGNLSVGVLAFLHDKQRHMTSSFKAKGDMIYMLGNSSDNLDSSEYIRARGAANTPPVPFDPDEELKLLHVAQKAIGRKLVKSAHGISRGGLFMAMLESAMVRSFGFDITTDDEIRKDAFLFGEAPSRIVVSVAPAREADFIDFMMDVEMPFLMLGHVTREEIRIDDNSYGFISDYKKKYTDVG